MDEELLFIYPGNDLGIKTKDEFIRLIEFDNKNAIGLYKKVKEALIF